MKPANRPLARNGTVVPTADNIDRTGNEIRIPCEIIVDARAVTNMLQSQQLADCLRPPASQRLLDGANVQVSPPRYQRNWGRSEEQATKKEKKKKQLPPPLRGQPQSSQPLQQTSDSKRTHTPPGSSLDEKKKVVPKKKLLTCRMIEKTFRMLDKELGKSGVPRLRMVVLGGALAVKKFSSRGQTVAIDMLLDPHIKEMPGCHERLYQCIQKVAGEMSLEQGWMKDHYKHYFTEEARAKVFERSVSQSQRPELHRGANLLVYAMDTEVALEMKLRRMAEPGRVENLDLLDATKFLNELTNGGLRPISFDRCLRFDAGQKKNDLSSHAVLAVQRKFLEIYNELGIVVQEYDKANNRLMYQNKYDDWVVAPIGSYHFK